MNKTHQHSNGHEKQPQPKHVQETDVHCSAEKDVSKERSKALSTVIVTESHPSQSDPFASNASHPIQHNLVIFPRHAPQYNLVSYRPATTRTRQNTSPPPTPQELRSTGLGIPGTTERRPARRPNAAAKYTRDERKDRSPGRQRREGHDGQTTTQDGKGDNIGETKERMRLRRETKCKSIGKADAGKSKNSTKRQDGASSRTIANWIPFELALNTHHSPREGQAG